MQTPKHVRIPLRAAARPLTESGGRVSWPERARLCISLEDAPGDSKTGQERLDWQAHVLEMMVRGECLADVLKALCRAAESAFSQECSCAIYLRDWIEARFRTYAAETVSAALSELICRPSLELEHNPCSQAVRSNSQVISADLEADPLWQHSSFSHRALAEGKNSCWATPIHSPSDRAIGVLAIFHPGAASPDGQQQTLIARTTHLASIAIERAQRDGALRRSEAFLTEAQRLSATGSFSWNATTNEFAGSEQLYRVFGFDQGVPVTLEMLRARVHPDDRSSLATIFEHARKGISGIDYEYRALMPDQSLRYLHLVARGTFDEQGGLEYIGAIQDVTNRRVAEEALARARAELWHVARVVSLGALSASITHEVNQPLSGIITNASTCLKMLASDPPNLEGARETVRRTLRDGSRAADVIARLRVLFGKKDAQPELVDLNEAARDVMALLHSELHENDVQLSVDLSDPLPSVVGDRVQLQQVILNLVLNACDAMVGIEGRPKRLMIGTGVDEYGRVRLGVTDSGVGLEAHLASRLSEPFYTTKSNGMGIGLFVSRSIVESHQGCLSFSSNAGPGATFAFAIPQASAASATQPVGRVSRSGARECLERTVGVP